MKKLTILGLRLMAIYVLIQILGLSQSFPSFFMYDSGDSIETLSFAIIFLVYWIVFGVLFFGAKRLATYIIPEVQEGEVNLTDYQKLSAILFSCIGILVVAWGFEKLLGTALSIINLNIIRPDFMEEHGQYYFWIPFFGGFLQIVAGLGLFIGGKKLAKWWNDFRNWT